MGISPKTIFKVILCESMLIFLHRWPIYILVYWFVWILFYIKTFGPVFRNCFSCTFPLFKLSFHHFYMTFAGIKAFLCIVSFFATVSIYSQKKGQFACLLTCLLFYMIADGLQMFLVVASVFLMFSKKLCRPESLSCEKRDFSW